MNDFRRVIGSNVRCFPASVHWLGYVPGYGRKGKSNVGLAESRVNSPCDDSLSEDSRASNSRSQPVTILRQLAALPQRA